MTGRAAAACGLGLVAAGLLSGCWSTPGGFDSPDPNARIRAIVESAGRGPAADGEITLRLIDELESVDPAARMLAINALRDRTGQTLGYNPAAPEYERGAAVAAWRAWAVDKGYVDRP